MLIPNVIAHYSHPSQRTSCEQFLIETQNPISLSLKIKANTLIASMLGFRATVASQTRNLSFDPMQPVLSEHRIGYEGSEERRKKKYLGT